jgi:hypothetical protein
MIQLGASQSSQSNQLENNNPDLSLVRFEDFIRFRFLHFSILVRSRCSGEAPVEEESPDQY